ncbi:MAG: hypothetical protein FJW96_17390, partial [Actinobacteria bacterium]|nr:hypothetical protein [Actinomycetota bacterium]
PAGPTFGSVGAPASASTTLAVGAVDAWQAVPSAHVLLRTGLRVLFSGRQPLGGTGRPGDAVGLTVTAVGPAPKRRVTTRSGLDRLFDERGFSRVAGKAALLPPGPPTPETMRDLAQAGARAVLVDGPVPAGALGVDDSEQVPIIGVPTEAADEVRRVLRTGTAVTLGVGSADRESNAVAARPASFSSDGLAFDGTPKPDIAAPGVGVLTSAPGRGAGGKARYGSVSGSSAAAAVTAGAAALLAQARPDLDAAALRSALVSSARPVSAGPGTTYGVVDPAAAASLELVADPPTLGLGSILLQGSVLGRGFSLRNTSRRIVSAEIVPAGGSGGTSVSVYPTRVSIRPGQAASIGVSVAVKTLPAAPSAVAGAVIVKTKEGQELRVPWIVAVPVRNRPLLQRGVVEPAAFRPSDTSPAVLMFTAGRVDGTLDRPALLPLARLEVKLLRRGRLLGTLIVLRNVLPGRYAVGLTGRGPKGARLGPGPYWLRIVARSVTGDTQDVLTVPFRIAKPS